MMKAEIASEMIRSRSQTPHPATTRIAGPALTGSGTGGAVEPISGAATSTPEASVGSGELSGMRLYCIQKPSGRERVVSASGLQ